MKTIFKTFGLTAVLAATVALAGSSAAYARDTVKTGTLTCRVSAGIGYIIGSRKAVYCRFTTVAGHHERYVGHITKVGIDIGSTSGGTIVWAVFEPTAHHHSLGGEYGGVTAEATVGAGLGANALVGGSRNSVALQPFSISGQTGLNLAAGVGGLTLRRVR